MTEAAALEEAVRNASRHLLSNGIPEPDALFLLGTGVGLLPGYLKTATRVPLERVPGVPAAWRSGLLHAGRLEGASVWMLEDAPGAPDQGNEAPEVRAAPWVRAFPCWLAAASGAGALVLTTAGFAVDDGSAGAVGIAPGTFGLVRDHINVSGHTPLRGLGDSTLGPLFPDLTGLHHAGLRARALAISEERGLPATEVVCACTLGPALETPAERAWLARAGADVAAQNLEGPLHAAAHAGLVALVVVCVTDVGARAAEDAGDAPDGAGIGRIVAQADRMAPALEELCSALGPELARAASEQLVDE